MWAHHLDTIFFIIALNSKLETKTNFIAIAKRTSVLQTARPFSMFFFSFIFRNNLVLTILILVPLLHPTLSFAKQLVIIFVDGAHGVRDAVTETVDQNSDLLNVYDLSKTSHQFMFEKKNTYTTRNSKILYRSTKDPIEGKASVLKYNRFGSQGFFFK